MNKLSIPLQFIIKTFLIAVFVNAIVSTAHILTDKDFSYLESIQIGLFTLAKSFIFFAPVYVLLFLVIGLFKRGSREQTFWIIILTGIITVVAIFTLYNQVFVKYSNSPETFAAIAAFSILVSLSSQYDLFMNSKTVDNYTTIHS